MITRKLDVKLIGSALLCILLGAVVFQVLFSIGLAFADPAAIHDPGTDPGGYAQDIKSAFKTSSYFLLVVLGLLGVSRAALYAATKWNISWLKKYAPILVTAVGVLTATGASLAANGTVDWQANLGAIFGAIALYLQPVKKEIES